ncbi:MAG TPA: sugar ABC transporter substrate-binding protein [Firmicutes bacterium]|nr:sugar ABC transporter substrate-binding protein [Bacillota bacterium]
MKKFGIALILGLLLILGTLSITSIAAVAGERIVFAVLPGMEQAMRAAAEAYKEKTGVEVVIHVLPRTGYREALVGPLSAGSGEFDVVYIQNPWLAEFAEAGFIDPLDKYLSPAQLKSAKAELFPGAYNGGVYDGKVWGLPWDLSNFMLFYRKDLIKDPPQTMDEYLELAKKFTKSINPNSPTKYGTVLEGSAERVNAQEWYNFLWSFGGDLFDENGKPILNSPAAIASLEYRYGMKTKYGVVPPDVNNYRYPEVLTAFQEGLVPMVIQWNAAYATFADPKQSPKIYNKFAATLIPGFKTKSGKIVRIPFAKAWYVAINHYSRNKKAAAEWILWFTGTEAGKISLLNGGLSSSVKAWSDPEVLKVRKDAQIFKETAQIARMTPNIPELPAIEDKLTEALTFVLAGKKTAAQALSEVNEEAYKILRQSGRLK